MRGAALLVALLAALVSAFVLLGENAQLPKYDQLKLQHEAMRKAGEAYEYDLANLDSPRLAGKPLQLMAYLMRTPVIGRMMNNVLQTDNKIIEIRKLASFISDMPMFYPFVEPAVSTKQSAQHLSLQDFRDNGTPAIKSKDAPFKQWTIADYTSRYTSGELSPVQVARAVLKAIKESEEGDYPLKLFIEKHDDEIMAQAKASAKRYAQGATLGVLDGVPVAIKDEMDIVGHKVFAGTSFIGDETGIATSDSPPVARLRAAGAIILGTTNMHEIGSGVTGYNMHYGTVRNPYNPKHYTGGSSSGSAAAVASGIVPLAVGVDGGGSVRIPAGICGVVGIKPTFQRVPPLFQDCPSVCHTGPIAGTVRDAAIGYAVMSGGDEGYPPSFHQPAVDLHSFDHTSSLEGVKIGYFSDYTNSSSPEIVVAVEKTLDALKARGAELIETKLNYLTAIHMAHSTTISSEMAQSLDKYYSRFDEISPEVQTVLTFSRNMLSMDYIAAQRVRAFALRQFQEEVLSKVDVFVTPTTGITGPEIPLDAFEVGELNGMQLGAIFRFSVYGNLIGVPGVAVPIGYDAKGLPISIQFQGGHWNEDMILRLAHTTERIYAEKQKQPQVYFSIIDDAAKQPRD